MSKVIVIELPDDADIIQVLHAIRVDALEHIRGGRVRAAIKDDAAKVLSVFDPSPSDPGEPR